MIDALPPTALAIAALMLASCDGNPRQEAVLRIELFASCMKMAAESKNYDAVAACDEVSRGQAYACAANNAPCVVPTPSSPPSKSQDHGRNASE